MFRFNLENRLQAFSLIEMLIVVAIIAILLGVLSLALSSWRSAAWSAKSLSNGRQLAVASINYASEHSGQLPQTDWSSYPDASGYKRWIDEILPYVYTEVRTNSSGEPMVDGVFRCPGLNGFKKRGDQWFRWGWDEVDWMNVRKCYVNDNLIPINMLTCKLVKTPYLVSTDKNDGNYGLSEGDQSYFEQYVPNSVWIYNGGVVVTYLDGHAEIVKAPNSTNIFKN